MDRVTEAASETFATLNPAKSVAAFCVAQISCPASRIRLRVVPGIGVVVIDEFSLSPKSQTLVLGRTYMTDH
ncbi:unannotated protein [freshwater metagenome]|uniref:Unannotated protein n=1 Tax=freshwater metagenome TaxID=449393 RepID=A0A6J6AQP6_9ZZZZ